MDRPGRVIVMKVGVHLGEPWETIVERKLAEERVADVAYWGYGGSVCHPITQSSAASYVATMRTWCRGSGAPMPDPRACHRFARQ